MNATGITEAFDIMAKKILKRLDSSPMIGQRLPQTQLQNKKNKESGGCCSS
jgi:hypothetical protein